MKKLPIIAAASVTGLALALTAGPAYAVDFSGANITFGTQYYYGDWTGTSGFYGAYPDDWQAGPNNDSFDEGMTVYGYTADGSTYDQVLCADPADLVTATDGSGDQILTCDPYTLTTGDGQLDVTLEYRFYSDFSFVRLRVIFTNSSGSPVNDALISLYDNYYQDSDTYLSASNTLGLLTGSWPTHTSNVLTDADLVYAFDDRQNNEGSPVVLTGRGLAGSTVLPHFDPSFADGSVAGNGEDNNDSYYRLPTVAPSQTVELALFHKTFTWGDTENSFDVDTLAAVNAAWAEKGIFDSFSGPLTAGIADPSAVLNWNAAPAAGPALANTGSDVSGTVLIAGVLLLLGAAAAGATRLRLVRR